MSQYSYCHDLTLDDDDDDDDEELSDADDNNNINNNNNNLDQKLPAVVASVATADAPSTNACALYRYTENDDDDDDSSSDDDDDDIVEVLSTVPPPPRAAASKPPPPAAPAEPAQNDSTQRPRITFLDSSDDDDSDAELEIVGGPTCCSRRTQLNTTTNCDVTTKTNNNKTMELKRYCRGNYYDNSDDDDDDDLDDLKPSGLRVVVKPKSVEPSKPAATTTITTTKQRTRTYSYDDDDDASSDTDLLHLDHCKPTSALVPKPKPSATATTASSTTTAAAAAAAVTLKKTLNPYSQESKEERAEQRRLEKLKRDELKKQEQLLRQEQRQQMKLQREQSKLEERDAKRKHVDAIKQQQGKFAAQEICILLDPSIRTKWTAAMPELRKTYMVEEYHSAIGAHAIQWVRCDYAKGGAAAAFQALQQRSQQRRSAQAKHPYHTTTNNNNNNNNNKNHDENGHYEHLDRLLIVFYEPKEFLQLLDRSDHEEDDDYPKLETWLLGVQAGWQAAWCRRRGGRSGGSSSTSSSSSATSHKRPRIVLLLHQVRQELDRMWKAYSKIPKRQRDALPQPPTDAELEDAMTWILIRFQVECVLCSQDLDMMDQIQKMTRALSERPYRMQVTELECIKKLKSGIIEDASATTTTTTNPYAVATRLARAKDTWIRQLQQIPHVSERKATNIARHYPTAQSLWQVYHQSDSCLTTEDKRQLVAGLLTEGRQEIKVSDAIYRIMTSRNPQEMI